ncbi:MAG TPA: hypothetical protein VG102_04130 [Candidatus Paceibacterota bacterium]|jgi:hypothetical protein|nr:hypothetical protein [Candidatus Paceibacterota bacterium]
MEPEEKSLVIRILEIATGITAVTTVVILSSVAGMDAYLAYQPSALQAQVVNVAIPVDITFATTSTSSVPETASSTMLYSPR